MLPDPFSLMMRTDKALTLLGAPLVFEGAATPFLWFKKRNPKLHLPIPMGGVSIVLIVLDVFVDFVDCRCFDMFGVCNYVYIYTRMYIRIHVYIYICGFDQGIVLQNRERTEPPGEALPDESHQARLL